MRGLGVRGIPIILGVSRCFILTEKTTITGGVKLMKIGHILLICLAAAVLGDAFLLKHNRNGEDDWAIWRDAHHCTPLMETDGSNRAGYRCDDGEVHYRWRQMR